MSYLVTQRTDGCHWDCQAFCHENPLESKATLVTDLVHSVARYSCEAVDVNLVHYRCKARLVFGVMHTLPLAVV